MGSALFYLPGTWYGAAFVPVNLEADCGITLERDCLCYLQHVSAFLCRCQNLSGIHLGDSERNNTFFIFGNFHFH